MTMHKDYPYQSVLAPFIRGLIAEKRLLGFSYDGKSYQLYRFDQYWVANDYNDMHLTTERLEKWICALPGESKSSQSGRISAVKSLAVYLNTQGIACDVPLVNVGREQPKIHLLDNTERKSFFDAVDSYKPDSKNPEDYRMADEYPVMFRLFVSA